ncbi:carboxypeptidase M32 [Fluoribacter dumoffii]|uniref:Metal-dependent carboxypeptidase n=1 Tax=Fluoribacter dumoffii TaxID=463 RepID=A0A377G891_9GAMM|nr:carboxypeptidase M32 [Fluoribacter dumoffii]KTC89876.1 thermostable carboxypeptidase 1 [Fluoribacter dumoffii NY 23]MCW8385173.1 carboxypeptidase M32 [Fluoribacter dumoffii]MCW8496530.1 carboxypeptidase M32 [Fluoribacter dumoffii]STO20993.1 Thermostable carboxypeptidase 1 [Fluoribacter dumoffii]
MNAYQQLEQHFKKYYDFENLTAIVSWDEATMMPAGGGKARAEALATLSAVQHDWLTHKKVGDLLKQAKDMEGLSVWQQKNLYWMEKEYLQATCIPVNLVAEFTNESLICCQAWRELRANNDWKSFKPYLEKLFKKVKTIAEIKSQLFNKSALDVLIDEYSPDLDCATITPVFNSLKHELPKLIPRIMAQQKNREIKKIFGEFPVDKQKQLGMEIMSRLGFDFHHGRLDVSHHPFCGGISSDVRITTRYKEDEFLSSIMAISHETGHALYEQGLPEKWAIQPVGHSLGMAVHESQSLFIEMQICRSLEYIQFLAPMAQKYFENAENITQENIYYHYTKVQPGLIRVDADEVTYPLHVILRYEIEQQLFSSEITIADLPEVWNSSMQKYLGLSTQGDDKNGVMQDVHWPSGTFGYFPAYTFGALIAAQLFAAVSKSIPDIKEQLKRGDLMPLLHWLRENIHQKGKLLSYQELLRQATGETLNPNYFFAHIKERYL